MEELKNDIKHELRHNKSRPDRVYEFMLRFMDLVSVPIVHHHYHSSEPQVVSQEVPPVSEEEVPLVVEEVPPVVEEVPPVSEQEVPLVSEEEVPPVSEEEVPPVSEEEEEKGPSGNFDEEVEEGEITLNEMV